MAWLFVCYAEHGLLIVAVLLKSANLVWVQGTFAFRKGLVQIETPELIYRNTNEFLLLLVYHTAFLPLLPLEMKNKWFLDIIGK